MARQNSYDDLDEMLVPQDTQSDQEEDIQVPKSLQKAAKGQAKKPPYQAGKAAEKRAEKIRTIVTLVVVFVALAAVLIAVGIAMGDRAGVNEKNFKKADPDPNRTMFLNKANIPELSAEGVKGMIKEAYFTVDGDLAVTLKLSNGTGTEHEVVRIACTIFNDKDETVARQTIDKFDPEVKVPAGGFDEAYFIIDESNVALPNDPLTHLGTTLEIGSIPADGSAAEEENADGPKAIAEGRTYYENTGNIPELSAEGVKGTIIRARYTNDGSLAVTLSLSNGTDQKQQVTQVDLSIANGEGATIAADNITTFETPCVVPSKSYTELDLIIDTAKVPLKDDSLSTLSCTVTIGTGPVADEATTTAAEGGEELAAE